MKKLPIILATSVVRGSQQGESHGGIYLVDFENQAAKIMVDWNDSGIDFSGRGWDRGLRGIEFNGDDIFMLRVMNYLSTINRLKLKGLTRILF